MLPLWLSRNSALDLVATLDPGDAVLAATLAVLHQQCVSTQLTKNHAVFWNVLAAGLAVLH